MSKRHSFLLRSLIQLLWKGFFIAFFSAPTSKWTFRSKPLTKNYCSPVLYNNHGRGKRRVLCCLCHLSLAFLPLLSATGEENCRGWKWVAQLWREVERTKATIRVKYNLSLATECADKDKVQQEKALNLLPNMLVLETETTQPRRCPVLFFTAGFQIFIY